MRLAQAREVKVEPALEQDHGDREADQQLEPVTERLRAHEVGDVGPEQHADQQQQDDPGDSYLSPERLRERAEQQRQRDRHRGVTQKTVHQQDLTHQGRHATRTPAVSICSTPQRGVASAQITIIANAKNQRNTYSSS